MAIPNKKSGTGKRGNTSPGEIGFNKSAGKSPLFREEMKGANLLTRNTLDHTNPPAPYIIVLAL